MTEVLLSLGANLGDPADQLQAAVNELQVLLKDVIPSRPYITEPVDYTDQPEFLNLAVRGNTDLTPRELLDELLQIEVKFGRQRNEGPPGGPRELDIDLILYGGEIHNEEALKLPHPRFRDRLFVLAPANEIAGESIDPVSGSTISQLLGKCSDTSQVRPAAMSMESR